MPSVVFLRGINVGGANLCKPAQVAKQLSRFDVVNIGAVGTFVVRKAVTDSTLRKNVAAQLANNFHVSCEIMIVPSNAILDLVRKDPFAAQPSGPKFTRFVSILHERPRKLPRLPLSLPSDKDWLLKIVAIPNRFVIGVYRREMRAISLLGKIEKILGVPGTVRNWNTIEKVVTILGQE